MASVLVKKPTTKLAWEAIAQMCVGSDHVWRSTLQKMFSDDDINEERAVKIFSASSPTSTLRLLWRWRRC